MAIIPHLVEKDIDPGDQVVDGIAAVVIAIDDTVDTTDALVRARAATVLNTALGAGKFSSTYFTSNRVIATTFDAAGDITAFNGRRAHNAIA